MKFLNIKLWTHDKVLNIKFGTKRAASLVFRCESVRFKHSRSADLKYFLLAEVGYDLILKSFAQVSLS